MSDNIAPTYHAVTQPASSDRQTATFMDSRANDNIEPVYDSTNEPISSGRRPSVQQAEAAIADSERRGSLAATPNPTNSDAATSDFVPPSSSVGTHNAPGKAGRIGEKVMGGFGYGGSTVERPKEEQGLGEKIVNFLGA